MPKPMLKQLVRKQHEQEEEEEGRGLRAPALLAARMGARAAGMCSRGSAWSQRP